MASFAFKKLIPLLDRVLVQRVVPKTQTAGGIILPDVAQQKLNQGVVVSVGQGARKADGGFIPTAVKEGDKVLLPEYGGNTVKLGETEYVLYRDEEILGILKD